MDLEAPSSRRESQTSLTRGSHPLSSKTSTVLSTSYADQEFRETISLLDERGVVNDATTRRQWRLQLQREVIDCNGEIIDDFGRVADKLRSIGSTLRNLTCEFEKTKICITTTNSEAATTHSEASALMRQKKELDMKKAMLNDLRTRFFLTEQESAILTHVTEPVDGQFFNVLAKAKRIIKDCEILLGLENQTLGHDVMEQTSKSLNLAYQKLYKWIQREFKAVNLENPSIDSMIREALRVLADKPSLFQNCLSFFAEARERTLCDSFYKALTGTTLDGVEDTAVNPIDMTAHDPLRYVGDMLAWVHSAMVGEREALEVLFIAEGDEIAKGLQRGRKSDLWHLAQDEEEKGEAVEFNPMNALNDLVDKDMSGVVRILRQRIEHVVQSNEDIILAYKLANLLKFYRLTFSKLLGPRSNVLELILTIGNEAMRQFRSLIHDRVATLQSEFQQTPADLAPPNFLREALKQIQLIVETNESSVSTLSEAEEEFQPILTEAFEPFMAGCENMSKKLASPSQSIFIINCQLAAIASLSSFASTEKRAEKLRQDMAIQSKHLVEFQYNYLKNNSGLEEILAVLDGEIPTAESAANIAKEPIFEVQVLQQASQILDDFLPIALIDAIENLKSLHDSKLVRDCTEDAARQFCDDFDRMKEFIVLIDEVRGTDESESLSNAFPRTTGEIRVLLS